MSYCRFSEGDVYLFPCVDDGYYCQLCRLIDEGKLDSKWSGFKMETLEEVKDHLIKHVEAGHKVPERAFRRIEREIKEEEK